MSIVSVLNRINEFILNPIIVLLFSIAFVVFMYGIVKLINNAADDKTRDDSKRAVMYGVIGMFVMVSAFGIIRVVLSIFGIEADIYPLSR